VPFGRTRQFVAELRKVLRAGRFDILHAHHDLLSGFYLLAAAGLPIGLRIVHVHNTDEALPTPSRIKQMLLKEPLRWINRHFADKVVGIADHTLRTFCHGRHPRAGRDEVLYYGCDLSAFQGRPVDRQAFRARLGLAEDARLVLFLGRVVAIKNPLFALDVFRELAAKDPRAVFLVAGDGPLRGEVERRARDCGIEARVRVMGWCDTPAEVMGSCDLFLFPRSEHNVEGFGLAVLEAQAAGLPALVSDATPKECRVGENPVRFLGLDEGAEAWATALLETTNGPRPVAAAGNRSVRGAGFSIENSARRLLAIYAGCS
jgi:glycosyltransferase involved in cell wall biosynthesis